MEKYLQRILLKKINRFLATRQIFAVLGPRQAGKTTLFTLIRRSLQEKGIPEKNIFYFTFEDQEIREQFNVNPKEFVSQRVEKISGRAYFFFDEYHWAKEGGQKLKLLFDLFSPKVKFFITGSSSLELTFQTGKYLVGRLFYFYLYPFSFEEFLQSKEKEVLLAYRQMRKSVKNFVIPTQPTIFERKISEYFEAFCRFGSYPEIIKNETHDYKKIILKSIINTYLEKDIRSLLLIEDLESYRRLLRLLASQIGNLLSYHQLSADSGLNFKLLKKHLNILQETYVLQRVRPFFKNSASELRKNPKLYFIDSGLRNSLLEVFTPLNQRTDKGSLVENFVFSQTLKEEKNLNFWRTKSKAEVDFILQEKGKIIPLEVKFQKLLKPTLSRSFVSFITQYQPKKGFILTDGFWGKTKVGKTIVFFFPVWYW